MDDLLWRACRFQTAFRARPSGYPSNAAAFTRSSPAILIILVWAASGPAFGYSDT